MNFEKRCMCKTYIKHSLFKTHSRVCRSMYSHMCSSMHSHMCGVRYILICVALFQRWSNIFFLNVIAKFLFFLPFNFYLKVQINRQYIRMQLVKNRQPITVNAKSLLTFIRNTLYVLKFYQANRTFLFRIPRFNVYRGSLLEK